MPCNKRFCTTGILACVPVLLTLASAAPAADREAAQWVIRQGGSVMVDGGEPIRDIAKLPAGDFRVTGVDLFGAPVAPKELEHLSNLTELRELYIYSRTYSPNSDVKAP